MKKIWVQIKITILEAISHLSNWLLIIILLADHLQRAKENPGLVSYLSSETQNELSVVDCYQKKKNKYSGILIALTSDLGHRENLFQVIWYVGID